MLTTLLLLLCTLTFPEQIMAQDSLIHSDSVAWEIDLKEVVIQDQAQTCALCCSLKDEPAENIEHQLTQLSGMTLMRKGNYGAEIVYRGLNVNQMNITVDGMKVLSACTDRMDPITSYLEASNIEEVQVNSSSSLRGQTSIANMNLSLREPSLANEKDVVGVNYYARYQGVADGLDQGITANFSQKNWGMILSASHRKSNDYRAGGGKIVPHSAFEKQNLALSTKYLLSGKKMLTLKLLADDAQNVGYPALPMDVAYAKARMAGASFFWWPGTKLQQLEWKVYANTIRHAMDDSQRENVMMHMDMPGNTQTLGSYLDSQWKTNFAEVYVKVNYSLSTAHAEMTMYPQEEAPMYMLTWPDIQSSSTSMEFKLQKAWESAWQLESFVHLDHINSAMQSELGRQQLSVYFPEANAKTDFLIPSLGFILNKDFNQAMKGKIQAKWITRAPVIAEQFGYFLFNSYDGYDYLGNPSLNPESCYQLEAGWGVEKKWFSVNLQAYTYWFQQYITASVHDFSAMTLGANGVKVYENVSKAQLSGASVRFELKPVETIIINNSWEYAYGKLTHNEPMPLISPLRSTLMINYQKDKFNSQIEQEWASRQERVNNDFHEKSTPAYILFHWHCGYMFEFEKFKVNAKLGVQNIFDREYRHHLDWGNINQPGRNVYVGLNLNF